MPNNKNDVEKDVLDLQTKQVNISLPKEDVQLLNQKSDLDNFLLLDVEKRSSNVLSNLLRSNRKPLLTGYNVQNKSAKGFKDFWEKINNEQ